MASAHIFRKYDIRGIVPTDLNVALAERIGLAFGTFLQRGNANPDSQMRICVGRDGRLHSQELQESFIAGVLQTGISVCNIGLATSPLLNFSVCAGDFHGGVNVTASHNPAQFNGFKLQRAGAHAIFGDEIQEIFQLCQSGDFHLAAKPGKIFTQDFSQSWLNKLASLVQFAPKAKLAIDCGNGVAGKFAPDFFRKIGCNVLPLFCEIDGSFPNHPANPESAANLQEMAQTVVAEKCALGIGFDGDGDRVGILDERGKFWGADLLLLLLARDLLTRVPGAKVVHNVTTSQVVVDAIAAAGGQPIVCKTGHSFIENKMRETGALLGGETSGHIFLAENYFGFDDAFLAAAKILAILQNSGKSLAQHFQDLPQVFTTDEIKVPIAESEKFPTMEKIVAHFQAKFGNKTLTIDGVKMFFNAKSWAIVRASNTSPFLTLRFESDSEEFLVKMQNDIFQDLRVQFGLRQE